MTLGGMAAGKACRTEGLEVEDSVVVEVVVFGRRRCKWGGGGVGRLVAVLRELDGENHTHKHNRVFYQAGNDEYYDVGGYLLVIAIIVMRGRKNKRGVEVVEGRQQ